MLNRKKLFTSIAIFGVVYIVLLLPTFGGSTVYADFYRKQGFNFFNNFGEQGFVVFEGHEDNGRDDTRVYQANKGLADSKGNVVSVPYNISTRILAYLPTILMISLFAATPIKLWKRASLLAGGLLILHVFLMFFLYILILEKYITSSKLQLYQDMGSGSKTMISYLKDSINHGMGLNNFLVVIIWAGLVLYFERDMLSNFSGVDSGQK